MPEPEEPPEVVPRDDEVPMLPPDTGAPSPDRSLTRAEITRILRLASDADTLEDSAREGVNVPELAEAAREAGIDPDLVHRAAAVVEDPVSTLTVGLLGAPDTRTLRAFAPGRRIPPDRQALVRDLEGALHRSGQIQTSRPDRLLWKEDHTLGRTTVSLTETSDGTEVRMVADRAGHYLGSWFAGVVGWGLLTALTPLGALGPAAAVLGFLAVPFVLARPFWVRTDRIRRRRLEAAAMVVLSAVDRQDADPAADPLPPSG